MPQYTMDVSGPSIKSTKTESKITKLKIKIPETTLLDTPPRQARATKAKFSKTDFIKLSKNMHNRFSPNSKKIGHAVILKEAGETIALQYALPISDGDLAPIVRPLINIQAIEPFRGMHRYRAETPNGKTPMYARRFMEGQIGDEHGEVRIKIACFSPTEKTGKQPFWGVNRKTPIFRQDQAKAVKMKLNSKRSQASSITKGGDILVIDHASIPKRDSIKKRRPSQKKIMGESARDAYESFFNEMVSHLHPAMKQRLKRAFSADVRSHYTKSNYRPEWLHAKGWSLTPMSMNAQTKDNLGAGPKWANTQMLILERIIKWFALNFPESLLSIKPKFDMLLDSKLIQHIDFSVRVQIKNRFVQFIQSIDVFQPYPLFPKASDLAQATGITHSMLLKMPPESKQSVKRSRKVKQDSSEGIIKTASLPLLIPFATEESTRQIESSSDREVLDESTMDDEIMGVEKEPVPQISALGKHQFFSYNNLKSNEGLAPKVIDRHYSADSV